MDEAWGAEGSAGAEEGKEDFAVGFFAEEAPGAVFGEGEAVVAGVFDGPDGTVEPVAEFAIGGEFGDWVGLIEVGGVGEDDVGVKAGEQEGGSGRISSEDLGFGWLCEVLADVAVVAGDEGGMFAV